MISGNLGQKIKKEREKKKVSLREFARQLGIAASYLVDIEKDRRIPSKEILQKTADLLELPISIFDEFSPEIPKPVRNWIEDNPLVAKVLKFIKTTANPDKALADLEKIQVHTKANRFPIAIYESELQAIGLESSTWETETGGDLFGIWGDIPIIYLASRVGSNAIRNQAHFRLDVDYLIKLSNLLQTSWGLRYFGDWHSHHRLGIERPSGGDRARIERIAAKNNFPEMTEFITTFPPSYNKSKKVQIHPYVYCDISSHEPLQTTLIVLKGLSPVREALISASILPEQHLSSFSSYSMDLIIIPKEPLARVPGIEGLPIEQISERALLRAKSEFEKMISGNIEVHQTSFGHVIVIPVNENENVAFAVDQKWPHRILQVDWIDRKSKKTEELSIEIEKASLIDITGLKKVFLKAKELKEVLE
jgi:transcriptional regulator with XRE-family HTH domain